MATASKNVRVFIEYQHGGVTEITGELVSWDFSAPDAGVTSAEVSIRGTGINYSEYQWNSRLSAASGASEWSCSYCGHINPRQARSCGAEDSAAVGCGAARSFIYN